MIVSGKKSHFVHRVALIAAVGGFLFGFDTGIISGALIFLENAFPMSTLAKEIVVASVVLGAFFGAISSGRLADHFGRRRMLIATAITFILGTALTTFTQSLNILVVGRFVLGIAIGISSYTVPLFISEMAPFETRGSLVLLNGIMITGGEAIAFLVDYALVPTHSWRWMFATGFIPAVILLIGMLLLPSTPRWLSLKKLHGEAHRVLKRIRNKKDVLVELHEIRASLLEKQGTWRLLFSKRVRPVLMIGLGLGILQQFVGINTVMYYGPYIFKAAGFESASAQILATFGLGVVNTLMSVVAVLIVDKAGRRRLLLIGLAVAAVSLALVGLCFHSSTTLGHLLMLICMISYIAGYSISIGSLFWLIIAEIYPLQIRGLAMSFVSGIQWLANFVVALTFLSILDATGPSLTLWLYGFMCVIAFLFSYYFVPETSGVSLEQIERNLDAQKPARQLGQLPTA
jgi:SP family galactose:H+ symporter-like MFS transporter